MANRSSFKRAFPIRQKSSSPSRGTATKGVRKMGPPKKDRQSFSTGGTKSGGRLSKMGPKKAPGIFSLGAGAKGQASHAFNKGITKMGAGIPIKKGR